MSKQVQYPALDTLFFSNENKWKVIMIDESNARIFLECYRNHDTDTIELDYVAYTFLLEYGFMYEFRE